MLATNTAFCSEPPAQQREIFSLAGKTAVITGGATGIGYEMSLLFAQRGAQVFIADYNEVGAQAAAEKINALCGPGSAVAVACNVASASSVKAAFDRVAAESTNGRLDILCNNAGIGHVGNITTTNEDDLNRVMAVNVNGVFLCAKEAVRLMTADDQGGVILNTGSCASICPIKDRVAYAASKGAVLTMTWSLATDHVHQGIRVNCICPGRIHTPFVDGFIKKNFPGKEEENFVRLSEYMPQGRMGTPGEVAALALYLVSDEARFVTGAVYPIDGGIRGVDHPKLYTTPHNKPHPSIKASR